MHVKVDTAVSLNILPWDSQGIGITEFFQELGAIRDLFLEAGYLELSLRRLNLQLLRRIGHLRHLRPQRIPPLDTPTVHLGQLLPHILGQHFLPLFCLL